MIQKLNPKLLHDLEQYYEQITLMYKEGVTFGEIISRLKLSDKELSDMWLVIFNQNPIYTANNIFEGKDIWQLNTSSLQSTKIKGDTRC